MLRAALQSRVVYGFHIGRALQKFRYSKTVCTVSRHTKLHGLHTAENQERIKGTGGCSLYLGSDTSLDRQKVGFFSDDASADDIAVPIDILCRAVHHDICAKRKRFDFGWRSKGVIHHDFHTTFVSDFGNLRNVREFHRRICHALEINDFGVRADSLLYGREVRCIYGAHFHAEFVQGFTEYHIRTAVDTFSPNDMVSARKQSEKNAADGTHTGSGCKGHLSAL